MSEFPKWQPMETAPKDGRLILVTARSRIYLAQWDDQSGWKRPRPYWDYGSAFGIPFMREKPPIAWMPLPPPWKKGGPQ